LVKPEQTTGIDVLLRKVVPVCGVLDAKVLFSRQFPTLKRNARVYKHKIGCGDICSGKV
jgi:hypothetical protein